MANVVVSGCAATEHQETSKPLHAVRLTTKLGLTPSAELIAHTAQTESES